MMIIKILKVFYWTIISVLSLLIIYNSVTYYTFKTDFPFLLSKQEQLKDIIWKICFYAHITGAMICIVTGIPQFFSFFLKKIPAWHIYCGKVYVIAILYVACPAGFYMSFFANGGIWGQIPFATIAVLWFITTWYSYQLIKRKDWIKHAKWMIRSYALTLSAVTFRLYNVFFGMVMYIDPIENYQISLWLSLVGNILLGELAILYYNTVYFKKHYRNW